MTHAIPSQGINTFYPKKCKFTNEKEEAWTGLYPVGAGGGEVENDNDNDDYDDENNDDDDNDYNSKLGC